MPTWHLFEFPKKNSAPYRSWVFYRDTLGPRGRDIDIQTPNGFITNWNGAGMARQPDHLYIRSQTVESEKELDWEETSRWKYFHSLQDDTTIRSGWLLSDGTFFRCHYHEHDDFLLVYLKKDFRDVDKLNIARVWRDRDSVYGSLPVHRLTEAQAKKLLELNNETG